MTTLTSRHRRPAWLAALCAAALLLACGGGGGGSAGSVDGGGTTVTPLGPGESAYTDLAAYSSAADASLGGVEEGVAVTRHSLVLSGQRIDYTARAGHLIARNPANAAAEASVFYVAYTRDGLDAATLAARPVTFFYNGGPGSSSVWLHLGSFGPVRLVTGVPATTATRPFPLVDNSESLLDASDLVFVNAVGTGLSQAIAPFNNQSFWSVDADAALFRDAIVRWLAANGRAASPKFLYGESYGGPRTAVLARLLQAAGVLLDGLVLQSPALDYNSNCGIVGNGNCGALLPTYGAIGAWHKLLTPAPADLDTYLQTLRDYSSASYGPAVAAALRGTAPPAGMTAQLARYTGLAESLWSTRFNLGPDLFQANIVPGSLVGRYDGRMVAPNGSPLASEGDPSSTWITASFSSAIASYLHDTLRYSNGSTYVVSSNAIQTWDFRHAGLALPDTVPDLAAALAQNPALRVLAVSGEHDLATPFRVTELDLARLASPARVLVRNYPGGHMSYLDDATRVRQKADLLAFYGKTLALRAAAEPAAQTARALAAERALGGADSGAVDRAGTPPTTAQVPTIEAPLQAPLRDPWVPPLALQRAGAAATVLPAAGPRLAARNDSSSR